MERSEVALMTGAHRVVKFAQGEQLGPGLK